METTTTPTSTAEFQFDEAKIEYIQQNFTNNFKFRMMVLKMVPLNFLTGMRIKTLTRDRCEVTVRHKWINKNPFRSMFWAVQGMVAEMASGAMLTMYTYGQKPSIATLVVGQRSTFTKKAVGKITFVCESGKEIANAVRTTAMTGEPVVVEAPSIGYDEDGDVVAEFIFTWSFKARLKK